MGQEREIQLREPAPTPYIDQFIDETAPGSESAIPEIEASDHGPPTLFSAAYSTYFDRRDGSALLTEQGMALFWRHETLDYGTLEFQGDQLFVHGRPQRDDSGERVRLGLKDFVLDENFLIDAELGHLRSQTAALLSSSYRFYLPSSLLQGASAELYGDDTTARVTVGHIGTMLGVAARAFSRSSGALIGAGATHRVSELWEFGGQFWKTNSGADGSLDHSAFSAAVKYEDQQQLHHLHMLRDSKSHTGAWYDGMFNLGRWKHRYRVLFWPWLTVDRRPRRE
jgi:hypothetical protein